MTLASTAVPAFVAAVHARDLAAAHATLSPSFAGKANGRALDAEGQVAVLQSFFEGFPDGAFKMEPTGGAGRYVIAWDFFGTHGGIYLGIPATGRPMRFQGYIVAVSDATGITSLEWKWDHKLFLATVLGPELQMPQPRADPVRNYGDGFRRGGKGRGPKGPKPQRQPREGQPAPAGAASAEGGPAEGAAGAPPEGKRRRRRGRGPRPEGGAPATPSGEAPPGDAAPAAPSEPASNAEPPKEG